MGKLIWASACAALVAVSFAPVGAAVKAPVGVMVGKDGVGVTAHNQPVVGVSVSGGRVCVGFSYQLPFCLPAAAVRP